jgi:hypothetical protein
MRWLETATTYYQGPEAAGPRTTSFISSPGIRLRKIPGDAVVGVGP